MDGNITINIVEPGTPPSPTPDPVVPNTGLFTSGTSGPEATIITAISAVLILTIVAIVITSLLYRKQKKSGKVTKLVHLVDSTKAVLKSNKHITTAVILLAILTSTGTFIALARNAVNASESDEQSQTEGTNDNSLTVDVSSEELTIEVGSEPVFAVLPVDITVEEATLAGYTLTAFTNSTDLVSTTDSSKVIPMVAADEDELVALADNTYGLALGEKPTTKDEAVYTALSTDLSNPTILKAIDDYSSTPASDTTTIYYGFYITPDTPYGTYTSSDIYYNATTNSSKVIFHGNGLYFNNNPEQTTNDVEYITGITEKTAKYSHTPNVNDEGEASGIVGYHGGDILNKVITIPGASRISIKLSYGGGYISGGYPAGFVSFWQGGHPDYTTGNNIDTAIKTCGTSDVTDGKFYGNRNDENAIITTECELEGNAVTFAYWTQGGGPSQGAIYGYYAVVTGYDADGNIIYLPGNTQVGGEYKDPAQDLPYIFLGWNEDKEATTAAYESKNDIELNLPLTKGKTTELYAIWQHATKIHFDGNGSTSGEIPDKLLAAGKGTSLCGNYSRDGYIFNNWNTKPDGSGESYGQCYWYTAPTDQSVELNLYAQWSPATTITYDGNGGEGNQQQQAIRAGETQNIWGNWGYFNKDGYAFSHWNTKPDGTGTSYYEGDQFTAPDQSTTIILYAQWLPTTTITFNGNGADSGSMAPQTIVAGTPQNLTPNAFAKEGYEFNGWNTNAEGTGTSYADKASYSASTTEPDSFTLYAQWKKLPVIGNLAYMQDFATLSEAEKASVLNSMVEDEQYQLKDNRDQKNYYVSKLADNNIWMTQNLDLNIEAGRTYTSADTDLANSTIGTSWTPSVSTSTTSSWTSSTTAPSSYDPGNLYWDGTLNTSRGGNLDNETVIDPSQTPGGTHYHIGNYYNWTAAVAMSDSSSYTTFLQDVNQSICPAGWRLPTYSGDKSYQNLVSAESLSAGTSGNIQNTPTYFVYGGAWYGDSVSVGGAGNYWSSVADSSSFSYNLYFDVDGRLILPHGSGRDLGSSLRCVVRQV